MLAQGWLHSFSLSLSVYYKLVMHQLCLRPRIKYALPSSWVLKCWFGSSVYQKSRGGHTISVLPIFQALDRTKCLGYETLIGQDVLMIQKQQDTTLAGKQNSELWTKNGKLKSASLISALTAVFSLITPSETVACSSSEAHLLTVSWWFPLVLSLPLLPL